MDKRRLLNISIILFSIFLMIEGVGYLIAWKTLRTHTNNDTESKTRLSQHLKSENILLRKRIKILQPNGLHIVVDTAINTLHLNVGRKTIRKVTISCGSGSILIDPSGKRKWIFETPKGEFTIQSKYVKPTWIKPDWAFVEEGRTIPEKLMDRAEKGVLGDYALGFGNGYFIHGTLYTRLLGKNITHGCIRVGDKDLKALYETVPLGTKIVIF